MRVYKLRDIIFHENVDVLAGSLWEAKQKAADELGGSPQFYVERFCPSLD